MRQQAARGRNPQRHWPNAGGGLPRYNNIQPSTKNLFASHTNFGIYRFLRALSFFLRAVKYFFKHKRAWMRSHSTTAHFALSTFTEHLSTLRHFCSTHRLNLSLLCLGHILRSSFCG